MATPASNVRKPKAVTKAVTKGSVLSRFQSELPTYTTTLPLLQTVVNFKPMTVKQRRNLSMTVGTGTSDDSITTLLGIVKDCCGMTDSEVVRLSASDLEWLLLQIHMKSAGETIDVKIKCPKCGESTTTSIDLTKAECQISEDSSDVIELGNNVIIRMAYPSVEIQRAIAKDGEREDMSEEERLITAIARMIVSIECGDDVELAEDVPLDALVEFVDELSEKNLLQLKDFFDAAPTVIIPVSVVCKSCGHTISEELTGLESFLV